MSKIYYFIKNFVPLLQSAENNRTEFLYFIHQISFSTVTIKNLLLKDKISSPV